MVSHAAAVNHLAARLRLDPESRLLNHVPLYLDRSVFELMGHVTTGTENVIAPKGPERSAPLRSGCHSRASSTAPPVCVETKKRGSEIVGVVQCARDGGAEAAYRSGWQNFLPEGLRPDRIVVVNELPRGQGDNVGEPGCGSS